MLDRSDSYLEQKTNCNYKKKKVISLTCFVKLQFLYEKKKKKIFKEFSSDVTSILFSYMQIISGDISVRRKLCILIKIIKMFFKTEAIAALITVISLISDN